MHIKKNVFDNVFNTIIDIKDKTKDDMKARMDLKIYYRRKELELQQLPDAKLMKPKAKFVLSKEQKVVVYKWITELRMLDGYASNLRRCVNIERGRTIGMKIRDCHVFMEQLLPIALSALPNEVWKPLAKLSKFFKDLCSTSLRVDDLSLMEQNIVITLCKWNDYFHMHSSTQ